MEHLVDYNCSG